MKIFRVAALTAALLGGSAFAQGPAFGYSGLPQHDKDDRHAYREGYEQGRADADGRRPPHVDVDRYREDDDRRAYREGYAAGYKGAQPHEDHDFDRDRDRDHDGDRDRNAYTNTSYGNGGYGSMSRIAQENGYRDGMNDGQKDRSTGHSFRPTHDDNYKNAPGYASSMGDRQQYKNMYRAAYEQAYPLGYNGRR